MKDLKYWIWLAKGFNYSGTKPIDLYYSVNDITEVYNMGKKKLAQFDFLNQKDIQRLYSTSLEKCQAIAEYCEANNIQIITLDSPKYPEQLKLIQNPPVIIYARGNVDLLDSLCISVVGTRNISDYGKRVTGNLCYELSKAGFTIVTGYAAGGDTYAHLGCIKSGSPSICVMPNGFGTKLPAQTAELCRNVLKRGLIITEMHPGEKTNPRIFASRNRIISALGVGLIITEAPAKSGTILTASQALEQGQSIMCVPPADIYNPRYDGVKALIRDGAKVVMSATDILYEYLSEYSYKINVKTAVQNHLKAEEPVPEKENNTGKIKIQQKILDETETIIYNSLSEEYKHITEISAATKLPMHRVMGALTKMELMGMVQSSAGKKYKKI